MFVLLNLFCKIFTAILFRTCVEGEGKVQSSYKILGDGSINILFVVFK